MRHQPHELAPLHDARKNLDQPHEHHCGEQIFNTVLRNQGHHHHGQGPCRARDHPRTPPDQRGDQTDQKRRIQPHQRVHTRNKGKGHRFGHEGQSDGQTRQKFNAQTRGREPLSRHPSQIGHIKIFGKTTERGTRHRASFGSNRINKLERSLPPPS